jgi:hypothetical protein
VLRIFVGYDVREAEGFSRFMRSLLKHASEPISVIPLHGEQRDGTNSFTYSRFLVPYLCDFEGRAIWMDGSDMLLRTDVRKLLTHFELGKAVSVVKHDYQTKHPRKYVGTPMENDNSNYERKNWSSLILWDCGHFQNKCLTPQFVNSNSGDFLHRFHWLKDTRIGSLPLEWNWLCQEYGPNPDAKLLHYTAGIPGFEAYKNSPQAEEWHAA